MPFEPDLLIAGGRVVSTTTGELLPADVVIAGDTIVRLAVPGTARAVRTLDATECLVVPGFIDAHTHVESSFLTPSAFGAATLARGTTTVLADPHEIVNVAGAEALAWMIADGRRTQQRQLWAVPSCVPSLDGLETAGAALDADDVDRLLGLDGVVALGEVMDHRAVVAGAERMTRILEVARRRGAIVDGHCPQLAGDDLQRYLLAGIDSDHCKNDPGPLAEKLRLGMTVMLQEKSFTAEVVALLNGLPLMPDLCLVSDDVAADAIEDRGHLDHLARVAVEAGMPPLAVLRALTLHPARRLRQHDLGVVAPGRRADLVVLDDLHSFTVRQVVVGGRTPEAAPVPAGAFRDSILLGSGRPDLGWTVDLPDGEHRFRAIRVNGVDTSTEADEVRLRVTAGRVEWEGRCARVSVLERHTGSGRVAHAPVVGMAPGAGAVATTYAHDSHNITAIATTAGAAEAAVDAVVALGGGIAVRADAGDADLPLPLGGVMTDAPLDAAADATRRIRNALDAWGWRHRLPFMSVSTLTLPVSPALKISDRGLIDVHERALVPPTLD